MKVLKCRNCWALLAARTQFPLNGRPSHPPSNRSLSLSMFLFIGARFAHTRVRIWKKPGNIGTFTVLVFVWSVTDIFFNVIWISKNEEMLRSTSAIMRSVTTPVLTSLWLIDTKKRSTARPIRARSVARVSRPLSCSRATWRDTSQSRRCSANFVVKLSILKVRSIVSFNELSMIFPSLLKNLYQ